ncbi:McrB family protein [candidate division KSB1 bacterium]
MAIKDVVTQAKDFTIPKEQEESSDKEILKFTKRFPLESLKKMSLFDYSDISNKNRFTYWLEYKTELLTVSGASNLIYGIYKSGEKYYRGDGGPKKTIVSEKEAQEHYNFLKKCLFETFKFLEEDDFDGLKRIKVPISNMVLIKISAIYYPEKMIYVGLPKVLIALARELGLDEQIDLVPQNSFLINYLARKKLNELDEFKDWHNQKIGAFVWEKYNCDYYIIGSKYGGTKKNDMFPEMLQRSIVCTGFASELDLSEYHGQTENKIVKYLRGNGQDENACNNLKYFLRLKPGDLVAVKSDGSPKGKKPFLSIVGIAEVVEKDGKVYEYLGDSTGQAINVQFLKGPVYKEFEIGGYGRTIHKISNQKHIDEIFKSEYLLGTSDDIPLEARVIYAYIYDAMSHRDIQSSILGKDAPARGGGFEAMNILHSYEIREDKKGILKTKTFNEEYNESSGKYKEGLELIKKFYYDNKKLAIENSDLDISLNTILYGPPGVGKTYTLMKKYAELFTDENVVQTKDEYCEKLVRDLTWWEVICITLLDLKKAKVEDIFLHSLIQAKNRLAKHKYPKNTIWGTLQRHTKEDCHNVKVQSREFPFIFWKDKNSVWTIEEKTVKIEVPELYDFLDKLNSFKPKQAIERRYKFTTFHQSYGYEEFIEGIKPVMKEEIDVDSTDVKYEIKDGVFKQIAEEAIANPDKKYALFIDEISRGNIANIFGELITLIEEDKRYNHVNAMPAILPYSQEEFFVPSNLYIIGTMNTADRSVEALDVALRRRFTFIEMRPVPELLSNPEYQVNGIDLKELLKTINNRIEKLLDKDYCIGHSYFMGINDTKKPLNEIRAIFQNKIIPLLQEYFYGDWGKIRLVLGKNFVMRKKDTVKFLDTEDYQDFEEFEEKPVYEFTNPDSWTLEIFKAIYESQ